MNANKSNADPMIIAGYGRLWLVGKWALWHRPDSPMQWAVISDSHADYPTDYGDGSVGYDRPEALPAHIRKRVERTIRNATVKVLP